MPSYHLGPREISQGEMTWSSKMAAGRRMYCTGDAVGRLLAAESLAPSKAASRTVNAIAAPWFRPCSDAVLW